jgi:DNA repair exonuclease SbcCD ATPase subunit
MEFLSLQITNFLTIGESGPIQLSNRGLNLLQGQNDDDPSAASNGAGKSSIPDALCWALYGQTARGESGDAVVNAVAKKDCRVVVHLLDGTIQYAIARHRKHSTNKNETHIAGEDLSNGMSFDATRGTEKETQAEIEKILGCSFEVFMAAIYAGQEQMPDLPGMTDKSLKLLIEEAAGVERLEKAYEIARGQHAQIMRNLSELYRQLENAKGVLHHTNVNLETAKLKHKEFEDTREVEAQSHEKRAETLMGEAQTIVKTAQDLNEQEVSEALAKVDTELLSIQSKRSVLEQYTEATIKPLEKSFNTEKANQNFALSLAKQLRADYDNADKRLGVPCTSCGKPHTQEDLEKVKELAKAKLVAQVEESQKVADRVIAAMQALELASEKQAELRTQIPDATLLLSQKKTLEATLRMITELKGSARTKVEQVRAAREQAAARRSAPNPQAAAIEMCLERVKMFEAECAKVDAQIQKAVADSSIAEAVVKVFGPAGVRAQILDTVTPFLNDRTGEYLSTLSDGNISAVWSTLTRTAKGELREKFNIDVENSKGAKSFKGLSGGEKRKVRLATMMALQDLVASRATKPLNLWIGDEVDDALDESGLERLMTILDMKAREKGTVLVISHNSLRDWIDSVTVVRKAGGKSTVEGALVEL